jgi:hypothetical protein
MPAESFSPLRLIDALQNVNRLFISVNGPRNESFSRLPYQGVAAGQATRSRGSKGISTSGQAPAIRSRSAS